jgi:hypothetical protein
MATNNNQQIIQEMKTALQTERDAYHLTAQTIMETQKDLKAVHLERKRKIVEDYEAQIVHDPEKHAKRDAYSLQRHFKHELEKFLENRTYGLTIENAGVAFEDHAEAVIFNITVPKKSTK